MGDAVQKHNSVGTLAWFMRGPEVYHHHHSSTVEKPGRHEGFHFQRHSQISGPLENPHTQAQVYYR